MREAGQMKVAGVIKAYGRPDSTVFLGVASALHKPGQGHGKPF